MTDRPILMSAPMVRACLREVEPKTQTRRIAKLDKWMVAEGMTLDTARVDSGFYGAGAQYLKVSGAEETWHRLTCPYGQPGDRLWVRETWCEFQVSDCDGSACDSVAGYRADGETDPETGADVVVHAVGKKWRPSIHMPRWASRITLEIAGVRVERLNGISDADARAEGLLWDAMGWMDYGHSDGRRKSSAVQSYRTLWESINGPGSWDANPWVWVVEFKRVKP